MATPPLEAGALQVSEADTAPRLAWADPGVLGTVGPEVRWIGPRSSSRVATPRLDVVPVVFATAKLAGVTKGRDPVGFCLGSTGNCTGPRVPAPGWVAPLPKVASKEKSLGSPTTGWGTATCAA